MQDKDEYIGSLLLSLFLMQGEINRLNETLDLARKGELVYINNPQIAELKAENERLYEEKNCLHKIIDRLLDNAGYSKDIASAEDFEDVYENMQYNRQKLSEYKQTLQEIKAIVKKNITYQDTDSTTRAMTKTLDLITKAEEE